MFPEVSAVVVLAWFTTWETAVEVLVVKSVSPTYTAVIECVPTDRLLVLKVATPEEFSVPVPIELLPSRKLTVPVGVPLPGETAATVAVNVTV